MFCETVLRAMEKQLWLTSSQLLIVCAFAACGNASPQEGNTSSADNASAQEQAETATTNESAETTSYVELTKRYIDYMSFEYAVDTNRIYGTGQSMGCMTTLILASEYPDLYAACMFVDGQWDISTLTGLENQRFVYFAAEDDTNAWNGAQEVMDMFDSDSVSYKYAQWDGNWSVDELSTAAQELFTSDEDQYFISWATGTIEPKSSGIGGSGAPNGGFNGPSGSANSGEKPSGGFGGPGGNSDSSGMSGGPSGGTNSSSYHMASFDYAYNCVAVMEWLFQQSK